MELVTQQSHCLSGCVAGCCVLLKPQSTDIISFRFELFQSWPQKVGDHVPITFTIRVNSVVTIVFEKYGDASCPQTTPDRGSLWVHFMLLHLSGIFGTANSTVLFANKPREL